MSRDNLRRFVGKYYGRVVLALLWGRRGVEHNLRLEQFDGILKRAFENLWPEL
jgi:hypothetical protein